MYAKLGSVAVQYAMGVNQIGTFYRPHQMSEEENRLFTDTIGRMGYMLDGGVHESNVAVYYPIEGIYIDTLPPEHLNRFNDKVRSTSANFSDLVRTLVGNQIDYDILDAVNLAACEVEEGALVTPSGERFKAIVVPRTKALEDAAVQKLAEAAAGGVSVIMAEYRRHSVQHGRGAGGAHSGARRYYDEQEFFLSEDRYERIRLSSGTGRKVGGAGKEQQGRGGGQA